jgi:hypothetical protein
VAKAESDVRTIAEAIDRFNNDVGRYPMFSSGGGLLQDSSGNVVTLRGSGNLPTEAVTTAWTSAAPADADCTASCQFDTFQNQLLTNAPAYPTTTSLAKPFKWKGPYIDTDTDIWGNMYLANIIHCKTSSANACFVLSAGPNGKVETAFSISKTTSISPGGDDVLYRIK